MARAPITLAEFLDETLYGYPQPDGRRGASSLREMASHVRRQWRVKSLPAIVREADIVTPVRVFGHCEFLLGALGENGGPLADRARELSRAASAIRDARAVRPRAFDGALRRWCERSYDRHRQELASWRKVRTRSGFRGRQPWQFVAQLLWPLENELFTLRGAKALELPFDAAGMERRYRNLVSRNRPMISAAARWYGRNSWRWIDPPELFPDTLWWREEIWEAHQKQRKRLRSR